MSAITSQVEEVDQAELVELQAALLDVYREIPVGIRDFISDEYYTDGAKYAWDFIKEILIEVFDKRIQKVLVLGAIGAGKSYLSSLLMQYILYQVGCLHDPKEYYGLAPGSKIVVMNASLSKAQAEDVVYADIKARVDASPWFAEHFPANPRVMSELRFPNDVMALPGSSKVTFAAGYSVIGAVVDEATMLGEVRDSGATRIGRVMDVAEEMVNQLERRIQSRFGGDGLLVVIGSPWSESQFMRHEIENPDSNTLVVNMPLWRSKQTYGVKRYLFLDDSRVEWRKGHLWAAEPTDTVVWVNVTKAEVVTHKEVLARMKEQAGKDERERDQFVCVPVEHREAFERRCGLALMDLAGLHASKEWKFIGTMVFDAVDGSLAQPTDVVTGKLVDGWEWDKRCDRVFGHIDLGLKKDCAGIALAGVVGVEANMPVVEVIYMRRMAPPKGGEIRLRDVRQVVYDLQLRGVPIRRCTFDGWQSADSIQEFQERGIDSFVFSVDRTTRAYEILAELMSQRRLRFYLYRQMENGVVVEPFMDEVSELVVVGGKSPKVDHRPGFSKDISDAVAGAVCHAVDDYYGGVRVTVADLGGEVAEGGVVGGGVEREYETEEERLLAEAQALASLPEEEVEKVMLSRKVSEMQVDDPAVAWMAQRMARVKGESSIPVKRFAS